MYLVQGQENTEYLLAFNVVGRPSLNPSVDNGGRLLDAYNVKFQIRDSTGADIFPGGGLFEDVTSNGGHVGVGRYYAFDEAFGVGWTPSPTALVGKWTIEWRWTVRNGDQEQRWIQQFQIESSAKYAGSSYATYLTPSQVRDEGIAASDLSDARLESLIVLAQSYIERATRNLFRPVYMELIMNGGHHSSMFLSIPPIGIEDVFANNSTARLEPNSYSVAYERTDLMHLYTPNPDRRRNPSVRFRGSGLTIFDSPPLSQFRSKFFRGISNTKIVGVFGFVESDGTVPQLIQHAMLRLVSLNAPTIVAGRPGGGASGPIQSETVDRHSITYAVSNTATAKTKWALAGSKEVEEILAMYKAPIAINAPVPSRVWDTGFDYGP